MELLTVTALLCNFHHDVLCHHEREFIKNMLLDHLGINNESGCNIGVDSEDRINGQECFRHRDTLVCRVVECSLKPLL